MATYFFDSSAISKHYHVELGSDIVDQLLTEPDAQHYISRLTMIEVHSVFARKGRMREISEIEFVRLLQRLRGDIGRGLLAIVRLTDGHYNEAERLLRGHALTRSLRTLDAIQLGVAVGLHRHGRIDHLVCPDGRLCEIAMAENLSVINPEQP
ncbi:MAG: type II toxin-antitoxin system VapC family toxin [Candidatus Tectomicrobia bacterium]|nr:type II toxin-antitoxin system VapC family toxin [Candidatus Tectomicrobia bacterium]